MFKLKDSFKTHDDNLQPYTMRAERHTEILDMHSGVDDRGFSLRSIGNRYLFNAPCMSDFEYSMTYAYTFMEEYNPAFNLIWGYDLKRRKGYGLRFEYSLTGGMKVSYISINRMAIVTLKQIHLSEFKTEEEKNVELYIMVTGGNLTGNVGGIEFDFDIDNVCGNVAIERDNFIGEFIMKDFSLSTGDTFKEEVILSENTVEIPLTEGGDIPYKFSYAVTKIENMYFLDTKLFGGTASRKVNREDRPGQYVAEKDFMDTPYVIARGEGKEKKYYIFNGLKVICDPNIFWECQKKLFGHPDMPIECRFLLDNMTNVETVSFGYNNLDCTGYSVQSGAGEHIFDKNGNLIYSGSPLGESIFELLSPEDKYATTLIPMGAYKRDEIIKHLATNHYFHIDEDISLTFSLKTKLEPEYITVKAEIRDVYDSETIKAFECDKVVDAWKFGYNRVLVNIVSNPLPLGLYRAVFTVFYGTGIYKRYDKIFEVFDKDAKISPAQASGLPYVFSMPNEQKWLARNTFDLWTPKASCDIGHYISCITDTPIEAKERRVWEVIKPFGREWFAWVSDRTCLDWSWDSHKEVIANCDYLYVPAKTEVFPLRNDLYLAKTYQNPEFRQYLHEFMDLNPQFAEKMLYKKTESKDYTAAPIFDESGKIPVYKDFTYEHLNNLMEVCHEEWMSFALNKLLENFREQNVELKKLNPNFKRTAYGPFNQYVTPTLSYHTIKAFGNLPYNTLSDEVYTGFAIFEDYPASCAYQTYRGAFGAMTIMLHCPNLRLYPEQYKGSKIGGCIDGAVKFSHAPMGKYIMPEYFNTTHAFEFVYNTPHKTADGYRYWDTYGFHRPDFPVRFWDRLVKDWKTAVDRKPAKPTRTMAMITEYFDSEDIYDGQIINFHGHTNIYNTSEDSHGYIYECVREAGLNAPFALKFDTVCDLSESECDVLVLPTLKYADKDVTEKIRSLYEKGVSLFAVSDVDGLEDIFGVKKNPCRKMIDTLVCKCGQTEGIYPNEADFKYEADGAEVIIASLDGTPVLMRKNNAVLLNAAANTLGHECFLGAAGKGRKNVSVLLRKVMKDVLRDISSPEVIGENVGVTCFEDENGAKHILCIDYTEYTNDMKDKKLAVVKLNGNIKEISSEREFSALKDADGNIRQLRFEINVHESVMFDIV